MQRNERATVHIGNLPGDADDDILFELAIQFGEVQRVTVPKDRLTGVREDYCFVEFKTAADARYFADVCSRAPIELYGKKIRVSYKGDEMFSANIMLDIGAKLCVRNLDPAVDEDALSAHFKQFGRFALPPKIVRSEAGLSRGVGFVSYDSFDAADEALKAMNNAWLFNRVITVDYADKPDGRGKFGSEEDRKLFREGQSVLAGEALPLPVAPTSTAPSWAAGLDPYARR